LPEKQIKFLRTQEKTLTSGMRSAAASASRLAHVLVEHGDNARATSVQAHATRALEVSVSIASPVDDTVVAHPFEGVAERQSLSFFRSRNIFIYIYSKHKALAID
jgi:hypothetical protein